MNTFPRRTLLLIAVLTSGMCLTACSSQANHIGAPWQWPGAIVSSGVSNAIYDARRTRVKSYVAANLSALSREALLGDGPLINEAARLAEVPAFRKAQLFAQLRDDHSTFFDKPTDDEAVEAVTIAFMVYSGR
jgi:hypothetical protein